RGGPGGDCLFKGSDLRAPHALRKPLLMEHVFPRGTIHHYGSTVRFYGLGASSLVGGEGECRRGGGRPSASPPGAGEREGPGPGARRRSGGGTRAGTVRMGRRRARARATASPRPLHVGLSTP